VTVQKWEFSHK